MRDRILDEESDRPSTAVRISTCTICTKTMYTALNIIVAVFYITSSKNSIPG